MNEYQKLKKDYLMTDLTAVAREIRKITIESIYHARSGHPGGSLSIAEILAVLYFHEMNFNGDTPDDPTRDRFILSKGHACPAYYAALALKGLFSLEDVIKKLRKIDSMLEGHPDARVKGIDAPSGSLGMGVSQGIGMALGAKLQNMDYRVYVLIGDGDMQEGNTWEGFMLAPFKKLDNLVVIYDSNKIQGDSFVTNQLDIGDIEAKLTSFGWHVEKVNGHNIDELKTAFDTAKTIRKKPVFIWADTIKGKGVSFMENVVSWHGSSTITDQEYNDAIKELI